jgi:hypothetical protein
MQKYRHIPVEVEAIQLTKENAEEVAAWCGGHIIEEVNPADHEDVYVGINFPTLDGNKRISEGQMLVRSSAGHFMVHNAGFFETMFKPIDPVQPLPHSHIPGARQI